MYLESKFKALIEGMVKKKLGWFLNITFFNRLRYVLNLFYLLIWGESGKSSYFILYLFTYLNLLLSFFRIMS